MADESRVALVTGANKDIGFEVTRQLARKGFHVFLGGRDASAGKAAAGQLAKDGQVTFLEIDVSKPESVKAAAEEFARAVDHLDSLVNNAGILLDNDKEAGNF
jgi:NAD(P)-dependent dehydrogenase (short-subunit alcohol dehydrogenase family)